MSELDQQWEMVIAEAERRARTSGRGDVVDYLALRSTNDFARKTAIEWLFEVFSSHTAAANRAGRAIQIVKTDDHRFKTGASTMVGTLVTYKFGLRSMMIEAGWPRVPQDGIVKGGGLARGHILHLGRKALDHELILLRSNTGKPQWISVDKKGDRAELVEADIRRHVLHLVNE